MHAGAYQPERQLWKGIPMSTSPQPVEFNPGELYARAMDRTLRYVDGVRPHQWGDPTPNTEWNVRDVINHLTYENLWAGELFAGRTIEEVGDRFEGDLLGDDPPAAYRRSVEIARDAVARPGAMESTVHLSFGDVPGTEYARQLFVDTLVHGWDIAKGSGQDTRLDPELVRASLPIAEDLARQFRDTGVYGEELPTPPDAELQVRLLAVLGRHA